MAAQEKPARLLGEGSTSPEVRLETVDRQRDGQQRGDGSQCRRSSVAEAAPTHAQHLAVLGGLGAALLGRGETAAHLVTPVVWE